MNPALLRDEEALAPVLARFPLEGPRALGLIETGLRNDSVILEDAVGARYVLRRYRRNSDERRIAFQLRFQRELHARGFPTAPVIDSDAGPYVVVDGDPWALFPFIEGEEYDFGHADQAAEAGRRLADFHRLTNSFDIEDVPVAYNPSIRRWWTDGEAEIDALARIFAHADVESEIEFLRGWQRDLVRSWPLEQFDRLPAGWLHGDYHGRNMVFKGDELRGLFDYDVVYRGWRVEDIAFALFMFGREQRGATAIRPAVARAFLDAYAGVRPLSDIERESLPAMAVLAWAPSAAYHEMLLTDGEDSVAFFSRFVFLMRQLGSEMERLMLAWAEEDLLAATRAGDSSDGAGA